MLIIAIVKGCEEYKLPILNLPIGGVSTKRNRLLSQQTRFPDDHSIFSSFKKNE
jgi:hypothetical protein